MKVMFDTTLGAKNDFKYKINEVNVSEHWDPTAENIKLDSATIIYSILLFMKRQSKTLKWF